MSDSTQTAKWMDLALKGLSVLVIPLMIWGVKLEVGNAVRAEKLTQLEVEVKSAKDIGKEVQANTVALNRMEVKIDVAKEYLEKIQRDLSRSLPPRRRNDNE